MKKWKKFFNTIDIDHNRQISFAEFENFANNHPEYLYLAEEALKKKGE